MIDYKIIIEDKTITIDKELFLFQFRKRMMFRITQKRGVVLVYRMIQRLV